MTSLSRRGRARIAGSLMAALALQACGDEADKVQEGPSSSPAATATSVATCAQLITAEALAPLAWTEVAGATADPDGCSRTAAEGSVQVMRLRVAAIGAEDLPAKVRAAYIERCDEMDIVSEEEASDNPLEQVAGEEVDWLSPAPSCVVAPDGRSPESALLTVTSSQALVEIRLTTESPTDAGKVRDALILLARAADNVVTAPEPS